MVIELSFNLRLWFPGPSQQTSPLSLIPYPTCESKSVWWCIQSKHMFWDKNAIYFEHSHYLWYDLWYSQHQRLLSPAKTDIFPAFVSLRSLFSTETTDGNKSVFEGYCSTATQPSTRINRWSPGRAWVPRVRRVPCGSALNICYSIWHPQRP